MNLGIIIPVINRKDNTMKTNRDLVLLFSLLVIIAGKTSPSKRILGIIFGGGFPNLILLW